ncbi:MAG TPA: SdrD B-like domain-containing protein [Roseiflexaceae bacterium]|nr:SdrD B-like domain-containing protein [Roseiflexaceae bacterium]
MHTPRLRPPNQAILLLVLLVAMLAPIAGPLARLLPSAEAAVGPQPTASVASIVPCIQPGEDRNPALPTYASPTFATACYGSAWDKADYAQNSNGNNFDANSGDPALVRFGDDKQDVAGSELGHIPLATLAQVGAVHSVTRASGTNPDAPAAARQERLFASAHTKRATRFGPAGPGGIYVVNLTTGTVSPYVQVPGVVPGPATPQAGPAGFPNTPGNGTAATFPNGTATYTPQMGGIHTFQHDETAIPYVGTSSLGGMALDPFERFLYVVRLLDGRVIRFDTWSTDPQSTLTVLPDARGALQPCATRGGVANYRPFALEVTSTSLYLGGTCTAETTGNRADLGIRVDRYDLLAGSWSPALGAALASYDTQRGLVPGTTFSLAWQPWSNVRSVMFPGNGATPRPMPLLTGLAFTEQSQLVLGLRDRQGDVGLNYLGGGAENGRAFGDLLIAEPAGFGRWGAPNPGAETYQDEDARDNEKPWGGVAYLPGSHDGGLGGEVVTTLLAPFRANSGGIGWFPAAGGQLAGREELYFTGQNNTGTQPATFAKTSGLGGLESMCTWRRIGDRVWLDVDADGVQDAGEVGLAGVRLQLLDAQGTVLATVTTDAAGNYAFYVDPFKPYTVRIDPAQAGTGPLAGLRVTAQNAGGDDGTDSDANSQGEIPVERAGDRDVNTSYDLGLTAEPLPTPNVWVLKAGPEAVNVGDPVRYALDYGNNGQAGAAAVVVTDRPPAGVAILSAAPPWTRIDNGVYIWELPGTLAAGATGQIRIEAVATAPGEQLNQATISTGSSGDLPGDNRSEQVVRVRQTNVYVQKLGPAMAQRGDQISYTLIYGNTGPDEATDGSLRDTLPPGLTFVSADPAPNTSSPTGATWNLGTLAAGAQGQITVVAQVAPDAPATVTNVGQIQTSSQQSNEQDDRATVTTQIPTPDLAIAKTGPVSAPVGSQITYTLAYTNVGTLTQGGTVQDVLPAGLTFVSATPAPSQVSGQTLAWTVPPLAPGASGTIAVVAQVALSAPASVTNTAVITATSGDVDLSNNQDRVPTQLVRPNVTVLKTGPARVPVGATFSYSLAVRNTGTGPAAALVEDTLPAGLRLLSATPAPSQVSGQTLRWDLGTLAPGAARTILVQVRAEATAAPRITNTATITTTTPGDDPGDNDSSTETEVQRPNLVIRKDGPASAWAGDTLTYTIGVTNTGDLAAAAPTVQDILPAGLSFVSATPAPAEVDDQTLRWTLPALAPGAATRITVVARLGTGAGLPSTLRNTATITTTTPGDDPGDNDSSTETEVRSGTVGDRIWQDDNGDGRQQAVERGIAGVTVELIDPATGRVLATTTTDAQGGYLFTGLPLGSYAVRIAAEDMAGRLANMTPTTPTTPTGTLTPTAPEDRTLDIGLRPAPTTAIRLSYFLVAREAEGVRVRFATAEERFTRQIQVLRSTTGRLADAEVIKTYGTKGFNGGTYELLDTGADLTGFNAYWLREVENDGETNLHGPKQDGHAIYLPQVRR